MDAAPPDAAAAPAAMCIVALIENRAKEVGCAVLDLERMTLKLVQFIEAGSSYTNTCMVLEVSNPSVVLLTTQNKHSQGSGLMHATRGYNHLPVKRAWFDDVNGGVQLERHACNYDESRAWREAAAQYLSLGAAGAALTYVTTELKQIIPSASLDVEFSKNNHAWIDADTVRALSLVPQGGMSARATTTDQKRCSSLFALLNHTRTRAGARLLRASLLQPLTNPGDISMRLDSVQELVEAGELLPDVLDCLACLPTNLEKVAGTLALQQQQMGLKNHDRLISALIDSVVTLRQILRCLPSIVTVLGPVETPLLQSIRGVCGDQAFAELLALVDDVLDENVEPTRTASYTRIAQCFAVKASEESLLGVARSSFCRTTDAIHTLAGRYRQELADQLPNLRIKYSKTKGWQFVVQAGRDAAQFELPSCFTVLERSGKGAITCTTDELNALNTRLSDSAGDCLLLTYQVLHGAVQQVVQSYLWALRKLTDAIALLDMLASLARFVVDAPSGCQLTRPDLSASCRVFVILQGRHALMERCLGGKPYQPHDTMLTAMGSTFQIITGPNMSGKTTYLQHVALVAILAQIGCFVPAGYACLHPFERIMSRLGSGDSLESNSSSFMVEMRDMAHILQHASPHSLVLIDELGRGTAVADAEALAWAISEQLVAARAPTLFATHLARLAELPSLYPSCQLMHLQVATPGDSTTPCEFTHVLQLGAPATRPIHYGLALGEPAGWPSSILADARRIAEQLDREEVHRVPGQAPEVAALAAAYGLWDQVCWLAGEVCSGKEPQVVDMGEDQLQLFQKLVAEAQALIGQGLQ